VILDLEETFIVGENTYFSSDANSFRVVFEDDLNTGYFYALDNSKSDDNVLDAMHIYNVADVVDKAKPSSLKIAWTDDKTIASLLINNYCHAVFDFKNKASYSRNGFPEPKTNWSTNANRKLTDELIEIIFKYSK
jgi:hypothetical protein